MLNKEITAILNKYNDVDDIANLITKSLIRYYSVNGFNSENFKDDYLNYLRMILSGHKFHFLDTEKLLSCKDQIFSTVVAVVREDLTETFGSAELNLFCEWQANALDSFGRVF